MLYLFDWPLSNSTVALVGFSSHPKTVCRTSLFSEQNGKFPFELRRIVTVSSWWLSLSCRLETFGYLSCWNRRFASLCTDRIALTGVEMHFHEHQSFQSRSYEKHRAKTSANFQSRQKHNNPDFLQSHICGFLGCQPNEYWVISVRSVADSMEKESWSLRCNSSNNNNIP